MSLRPYPIILLFFLSIIAGTPAVAQVDLGHYPDELGALGALIDAGQFEDVMVQGTDLLARVQTEFPDGSFDEAKVLDFLVYASYRTQRVMDPNAVLMGEKAIKMKEQVLGKDHPELANSHMHFGNLLNDRWEMEKAIENYDKALAILTHNGLEADAQCGIILNSKGVACRRLAQSDKAMQLYTQALRIQENLYGPDHQDVASTLNNMANIQVDRGNYASCEKLHRRALAIREKVLGPDHLWVGESANGLASVLGYLGRYDESLVYQERAVAIYLEKLGAEHQSYWWTKFNLAVIYLDMGDPSGSVPIFEDVLVGIKQRYGETHPQTCYVLDGLASCYYALGEYERALGIYTESLQVSEAAYGPGDFETNDTIMNQGKCLIALGHFDEAAAKLETSLAIQEAALEKGSPLLCGSLNHLAEVDLRRENYAEALIHATRSSTICSEALGENHPLFAESSLLEGRAFMGLGDTDSALLFALKAEGVSRRHLHQTMHVLSEGRALDYAGVRLEGLDLALSVLQDHETGPRVARVWDAIVRSRAAVLEEYTARNRFLSNNSNPEIAALMDSSRVLRERLVNLNLRGPGWEEAQVYRKMLSETETELQGIERKLSLKSAEFRNWQEGHILGYEHMARALPGESSVVAMVRGMSESGEESYKAFVLKEPGAAPQFINLGPAREIDAAVSSWRDQVALGVREAVPGQTKPEASSSSRGFLKVPKNAEAQLGSYLREGRALRRLVWDPICEHLNQSGAVFFVPDGSIQLINFGALPDAGDGFLIQSDYLFHILISEKSLNASRPQTEQHIKLLALGGVDYDLAADRPMQAEVVVDAARRSAFDGLSFSALPHAGIEVQTLDHIWSAKGWSSILLEGAAATEENLKTGMSQAQILHLATHGFCLPETKATNGLSQKRNALVCSGLALAGANSWRQAEDVANDGLLTAEEVSALDLSGVQWAVLSACGTGLGVLDARDEGVFGLRRVFSLAGARTVIMSLWAVDDAASQQWMNALYEARWIDGMSTSAAVKQASIKILEQRQSDDLTVHPYYWAGFVAAGDWR